MLNRCSCLLLVASLWAGCFQQDKPKTSKILPPEYQSSFVLARSCRYSTAHGRHIKVLTNSMETNAAYVAGNGLLPVDSLILAEEYEDTGCSSLLGYTLMHKEAGYDPSHNDWHWQKLDDMRDLLDDGRVQTCIDCHQKCSEATPPEYTCTR